MKIILAFLSTVAITGSVLAGTLTLAPGEKTKISSNTETTVQCSGEGNNGGQGQVEYNFCECKENNVSYGGIPQISAAQTIKYANANPVETQIKLFNGITALENCKELLRTISACRDRR